MDLFLKISLDFEAQFEYNICYERIFKATMVNTRESNVERALLQMTVGELQEKVLPHRTENSIRKQVAYLRKRGWSF